jgi:toxin ParE1/3/4
MTYRLTRRAKSDIKAISRYTIEYFGEGQTQEYLDGLAYSFDLLTDNPNMGRAFEGDMRRYVYKSHLVYYEIKKDVIHILRIRHGRTKP